MAKLEDYCIISSGGTPSRTNKSFYGGNILWTTISDIEKSNGTIIDTKEKITQEGLKSIGNRLFPKGTLLLSMYGSIGKTAIAGKELSTNQAILGIRPKNEDDIYLPYLSYWIKRNVKSLQHKARGGILKNLSAKIVKNIKIDLPKYEEQKKIANLLSQIETLVLKREKTIELLDKLVKSTFLDMFGDPVVDSKDFGREQLNKFGKVITGNTPPRAEKSYYDNNYIEWIKTDNLFDDKLYATKAKEYLSQKGLSIGRSVKSGSLLVTCIAGSVKSIGTASLVDRNVAFNQQINAIEPFDDVDSFFLYWMFKISKKYVQDQAGKGMKKIINKSAFEAILFPKPEYDLQKKFGTIAKKIETTKKTYQKSLDELNQLFASASQKAFKGQLDLGVVTLNFEDKFPDILDEIVKEEKRKNTHFEKAYKKYTTPFTSKTEDGEAHGHQMDAEGFKNLIKEILQDSHSFEELQTKMFSKNWIIPYDEDQNKKEKPFTFKDTIFQLLKEGEIVQQIREYKKNDKDQRKIVLKALK